MKRRSTPRSPLAVAFVASALVGASGLACGNKKGDGATTSPAGSASAPVASASAPTPSAPPDTQVASAPVGDGVGAFVAAAQTEACKAMTGDVASYLQRGEVTVAGREGAIAASWLIKMSATKPGAQLAFAGFDLDAKQVARARGIGSSSEMTPRLFASGTGWTLVWFDAEGLAFTRPRWETQPAPVIEHLRAISGAAVDDVALDATPAGSLVAVAPFNVDKTQLGLFLFAPSDAAAPPVQALGATHHAKAPKRPAVAADAGGYTLAWEEENGRLAVSRFDLTGKELPDEPFTLAAGGTTREHLVLTRTEKGAIAVWSEGDRILGRAMDASAKPADTTYVIGKGRSHALAPLGEGAVVTFLGQDGATPDQVLAVRLGADGAPSAKGMRVNNDVGPVKDAPAVAAAGARTAFLWTEPMAGGVATKRAVLRTVDSTCVP
ncbi:hypothetical protein [Polyangium aurulentum]|uniref:hypothetical protein n=1 Tax=Polyangium aurulentum TaxID=2567896 RepID=UPI0010AE8B1D|nr:hypothetical protein [Polyangium aurulentum]UQA58762.1 hypothetical protein E8A73_047315 [Polyangium aurulentum]